MADGLGDSTGPRDTSFAWRKSKPRSLQRKKDMNDKLKTSTLPKSSAATDVPGKPDPKKPAKDEPRAAAAVHKTDRPGFDLGGSSGDTHAGTGLGLGEDAFDTPGDRRLPGRRLDGKLTIPRWSGPEPEAKTEPVDKTAGAEPHLAPKAKTTR
jgi:hypothetical protein